MTKLYQELVGHILKKWPEAELYIHSGSTIHENEITFTFADVWFITLSFISGKISALICLITGSVKTSGMGYKYLKEYHIGRIQKEGKYPVKCMPQQKDSWLGIVYWSLSELLNDIKNQISANTMS